MSDPGGWFRIGHATRAAARTGCTVIVFDRLSPACVDSRGGAPGTRETDLLSAGRLVGAANALLLTGGSAFGLAAADGVRRWLSEQGRGFPTAAGPVPIVPAAVLFDLANGEAVAPDAADGYAAADTAGNAPFMTGLVGAGTGTTVAKLGGASTPGGIGIGTAPYGPATVTAVVALNAVGDIREPDTGRWLARSHPRQTARELARRGAPVREGEHTSIGAVLVSTPVTRDALWRCCVAAHDALARCVSPAHTIFDGDTFFSAAPGLAETPPADMLALQVAVETAVEAAIVGVFAGR